MFTDDVEVRNASAITIYIVLLLILLFVGILKTNFPLLKDNLFRRFSLLWIVVCVISLLYSIIYPMASRNTYGMILLPFLFFYYSAATFKYIKSDKVIIWVITLIFFLLSYYFLNNYYNNINIDTNSAVNGSYPILYLLPFMLCHKKKVFRSLAFLLTLVVIMFSLKRGGFLALLVGLMAYLLASSSVSSKRLGLWKGILLVLIPIAVYFLVMYINNDLLGGGLFDKFRNDETEGSGRMALYAHYSDFIINSRMVFLLFGHGWQGSIRDSGIGLTCHNDFLESMVDFGIFGLILYVSLYVKLFKFCRSLIKNKHEYAPAMAASLAIFFVNSMVSHILIYPNYLLLFTFFWGFVISRSTK